MHHVFNLKLICEKEHLQERKLDKRNPQEYNVSWPNGKPVPNSPNLADGKPTDLHVIISRSVRWPTCGMFQTQPSEDALQRHRR